MKSIVLLTAVLLTVGCTPKRIPPHPLSIIQGSTEPGVGIPKDCVTAMSNDPQHPLADLGNGWWYGPMYVRGDCIKYLR